MTLAPGLELAAPVSPGLPAVERPRAQRGIRGYYSRGQVGRVAADGSLLAIDRGDCAISSSWTDPACELLQCKRPEVARMVPDHYRRCRLHGLRPLPAEDPYPLEGEEWRAAERAAWLRVLAPKHRVPLRYRNASLAGKDCPAIDAARAYCDPECDDYLGKAMVLEGRPGCGKTFALRSMQRYLIIDAVRSGGEAAVDVVFFDFPALGKALLDPDERDEALETCRDAGDLLIDDVGSGFTKADGFVVSMFEQIVIEREANMQPLVISTNLDPNRFAKLFGPRVLDRLGGEWGMWLDVDGPSFRRTGSR